MRLLAGALACLFALSFIFVSTVRAESASSSVSQSSSGVQWLALKTRDTTPVVSSSDPKSIDPQNEGPVLLPLPPEGWTCIALMTAMVAVRSLKRARVI